MAGSQTVMPLPSCALLKCLQVSEELNSYDPTLHLNEMQGESLPFISDERSVIMDNYKRRICGEEKQPEVLFQAEAATACRVEPSFAVLRFSLVCSSVAYLFSSHLGNHVGDTLWV